MLFHTWTFALFFLIFYPVYLALKGSRLKLPWMLLASYVFYGWWNPLYLILILWSTSVDYVAVIRMARSGRRKPWLVLSLVNNLGLLGFFKYGQFVTDNLNAALAAIHVPYAIPAPGYLLPVGISFYVFQSMSYTIDFYRGNVDQEPNFIRYATFVSLFPQLVAGPIERARNLLPQLRGTPKISAHDVADGLSLFVVGLFKKVALADYIALYVDPVYSAPGQYQAPALILATFAFGWQIYFDFSGYTDMARGIGRMMGIRLMLNFNNPYLATGLGDFWRRWHISLSTWFRDYVYIPLGGNRYGTLSTYWNMCLTMVISGLWHGAAWTFVIWGGLHALGYSLTRPFESTPFYKERVPKLVKWFLVFWFVTFTWIFFRAESFADAWLILTRIFAFGYAHPIYPLAVLFCIGLVWLLEAAVQFGRRLVGQSEPTPVPRLRLLHAVVSALILNYQAICLFAAVGALFFLAAAPCSWLLVLLICAVWYYQLAYESRLKWVLGLRNLRIGLVVAMVLWIALFAASSDQPFIYFQF